MYLAKYRGCYSIHPETCILHFAWFLLKHSWNNSFGKSNVDCTNNTCCAEGKWLIDNSSRPLKNGIAFVVLWPKTESLEPFSHHGSITVLRVLESCINIKQQACRTSRRQNNKYILFVPWIMHCLYFISSVFLSTGVYEETVAAFFLSLYLYFCFRRN